MNMSYDEHKQNAADFADFIARHPVGQDTHTGLWGYNRINGCLDLSRLYYKSKRAAQLARAREYRDWRAASAKSWHE